MRRKLIDLVSQRTQALETAETALNAGKRAEYDSAMEKVTNLNGEIKTLQDLIAEKEKSFGPSMTPAEKKDMAAERGNELLKGHAVTFDTAEVRRVINSVTLATGTLAESDRGRQHGERYSRQRSFEYPRPGERDGFDRHGQPISSRM